MRLFVALTLPETAREHLAARLDALPAPLPQRLRLTRREQWHLTLAFLADVAPEAVATLTARLAEIAGTAPAFPARLAGSGAFPRPARATTLWCGLDPGRSESTALATAVGNAVGAAGLVRDERPYRPHVTLGRCPPADLRPIVAQLEDYRGPEFRMGRITLFRSRLGQGPGGSALHEAVESWSLPGRPP